MASIGETGKEPIGQANEMIAIGQDSHRVDPIGLSKEASVIGQDSYRMVPIGHIQSVFKTKNGTPRQSGICANARATLRLNKTVFNNPEHALENLSEYSHVWILWIFHQNSSQAVKAKVAPPRLGGKRVGVFSSRSPHRPNPIGLTLARLERVEEGTLHLLGVDIVDGTPVLDIKPYIPLYDSITEERPPNTNDRSSLSAEPLKENTYKSDKISSEHDNITESDSTTPNNTLMDIVKRSNEFLQGSSKNFVDDKDELFKGNVDTESFEEEVERVEQLTDLSRFHGNEEKRPVFNPDWIGCERDDLQVSFTPRSLQDLQGLDLSLLSFIKDRSELQNSIREVLASDPRSVYRKNRCTDRLYYTSIDRVHVTSWFDPRFSLMEVLAVKLDLLSDVDI